MVPDDMEDRMTQRTVAITGGHGVLGRAVLDVDATTPAAFDAEDQVALERLMAKVFAAG